MSNTRLFIALGSAFVIYKAAERCYMSFFGMGSLGSDGTPSRNPWSLKGMSDAARDCRDNARDMLRRAGYGVSEVYKVIEAGASGENCDVVLYRNTENELYEAFVGERGKVIRIQPGW